MTLIPRFWIKQSGCCIEARCQISLLSRSGSSMERNQAKVVLRPKNPRALLIAHHLVRQCWRSWTASPTPKDTKRPMDIGGGELRLACVTWSLTAPVQEGDSCTLIVHGAKSAKSDKVACKASGASRSRGEARRRVSEWTAIHGDRLFCCWAAPRRREARLGSHSESGKNQNEYNKCRKQVVQD